MNDETSRFVDQEEVTVFVEDFEGNVFGINLEGSRRGLFNHDHVTGMNSGRGLPRNVVHQDVAGVDQLAGTRSGPILVQLGKASIESSTFQIFRDRERSSSGHAALRRLIHRWRPVPVMIRESEMS